MPQTDYSKALIYEFKCKNPQVKYFEVGGTTNLKNIKYRYRKAYMDDIQNELNTQITANGGFDNWHIKVLEQYEKCTSKNDLNQRVERWDAYKTTESNNPVFIHQNPPTLVDHPQESYIIHTPEGKKTECLHCKKSFSRSDSLKRHLQGRCSKINNSYKKLLKENESLRVKCRQLESIIEKIKNNLNP